MWLFPIELGSIESYGGSTRTVGTVATAQGAKSPYPQLSGAGRLNHEAASLQKKVLTWQTI